MLMNDIAVSLFTSIGCCCLLSCRFDLHVIFFVVLASPIELTCSWLSFALLFCCRCGRTGELTDCHSPSHAYVLACMHWLDALVLLFIRWCMLAYLGGMIEYVVQCDAMAVFCFACMFQCHVGVTSSTHVRYCFELAMWCCLIFDIWYYTFGMCSYRVVVALLFLLLPMLWLCYLWCWLHDDCCGDCVWFVWHCFSWGCWHWCLFEVIFYIVVCCMCGCVLYVQVSSTHVNGYWCI